MKKQIIHAVHEKELIKFLQDLGLLNTLREGKLFCSFCGSVMTEENLLCVYPSEGKIKVCCSEIECYEKLVRKRREKEKS